MSNDGLLMFGCCNRRVIKVSFPLISPSRVTPGKWVWIKIKPPGYGPQVVLHVSTYRSGGPFWVFQFLTTAPIWVACSAFCCQLRSTGAQALDARQAARAMGAELRVPRADL